MRRNSALFALVAVIICFVVVLAIVAALFAPSGEFWLDGTHMQFDWSGMWWLMILGMLVPVVIVLIVVLAILSLRPTARVQYGWRYEQSPDQKRQALEVLGERYARGEITREEYLRMKDDLR